MDTSLTTPTHPPGQLARQRSRGWGIGAFVIVGALTGLLLRLLHFSAPPYDAHAFRQTQTLSTVEFFYSQGIDLVRPKTLYMGYPGVLVLELPIFQAFAALLYHLLGPHFEIVRVLNILFGAGTAVLLYCVVELLLDRRTAIFAALIYWLGPTNVGYQRSMLIDPTAVFFGLLSFYFLARLTSSRANDSEPRNSRRYWLEFALFSLASWITAMMKALYLWPTVLLLADALMRRRSRLGLTALRVLAALAVAGFSFLAWNRYAARINDASPFTRGIKPTALLGLSPLIDPQFYLNMIVRRPKWWLGVFGALLYPVGLLAGWSQRHDAERSARFLLLLLIPPTYLLTFSFINRPHDYYQLIITPFLAVTAGFGLDWLARRSEVFAKLPGAIGRGLFPAICVCILVAAPLTYISWYHGGRPDAQTLRFEQLCAGRIQPGCSGMVFVANANADAPPDSDIPEFLYAAHLWGIGKVVSNDLSARQYFEQWAPEFPKLEYVILYGTERPPWLSPQDFRLTTEDVEHRLYVFRRIPPG